MRHVHLIPAYEYHLRICRDISGSNLRNKFQIGQRVTGKAHQGYPINESTTGYHIARIAGSIKSMRPVQYHYSCGKLPSYVYEVECEFGNGVWEAYEDSLELNDVPADWEPKESK